MILIGNLLSAIAVVLKMVLGAIWMLVLGRVIISWVNADPYNPIVRFLTQSTEPFLAPIRKRVRPVGGGIDLSPLILLILITFLQEFLVQSLLGYAVQLRGM